MLRWSEHFIEQPDPVFGGLPVCPFAKAARLKRSIRFEVRGFAASDPSDSDGRVMTLIEEFLADQQLETLSSFIQSRTASGPAPWRPGSSA
jgi:hypothetical protein